MLRCMYTGASTKNKKPLSTGKQAIASNMKKYSGIRQAICAKMHLPITVIQSVIPILVKCF